MKKFFMAATLMLTMLFTGCGGDDANKSAGDAPAENKKIVIGLDDEAKRPRWDFRRGRFVLVENLWLRVLGNK